MRTFTLFCLLLAFVGANAQIIHIPGDYPTIQQGIIAASPGDTVLVADGVYFEQIDFTGKAITVASYFIIDADSTHIDNTILDGQHLDPLNGSVVKFVSGEDTTSVINGFTIQNGKGTMIDMEYLMGGGIYIANSGAKILNNRIQNNNLYGQSLYIPAGAGIATAYAPSGNWVVIEHNTVEYNQCISDWLAAAGAIISSCNTRMEGNNINNNKSMSATYRAVAVVSIESCMQPPNDTLINTLIAINNRIHHNTAECTGETWGGGMYCGYMNAIIADNKIYNNQIISNQTGFGGAALFLKNQHSTIIKGNTFSDNSSTDYGGGIVNAEDQNSEPILIQENNFTGNHGKMGGAIYGNPNFVLKNNVFESNSASDEGGALKLNGAGYEVHCLIENNTFNSNNAGQGGAVNASFCDLLFTNNVFTNNSTNYDYGNYGEESYGGAICLRGSGAPLSQARFVNNTFSGNYAFFVGGGAVYSSNYNPKFLNTIFWGDYAYGGGNEIYIAAGGCSLAYCDIDPSSIYSEGTIDLLDGNINNDPDFCQGVTQSGNSPCDDAGTAQYTFPGDNPLIAPDFDIRGNIRPLDNGYDLGAYEVSKAHIINVPAEFTKIQEGINAAYCGDTVLVADGIYYEQINFLGKSINLASHYMLDNDTSHIANTVIDGSLLPELASSIVLFISGEDTTSVLNGFTLRNGKGTYVNLNYESLSGGGVNIVNSGAKVINNRITNNILNPGHLVLNLFGAAICALNHTSDEWVVIRNNKIDHNQSIFPYDSLVGAVPVVAGSAIYSMSNTFLENNIIQYNITSSNIGTAYGVIYCDGNLTHSLIANKNRIDHNISDSKNGFFGGYGAGLFSGGMSNVITDNIISNNKADDGVGVCINWPLSLIFKGNKVVDNKATSSGVDIKVGNYTTGVLIENNTFSQNEGRTGAALSLTGSYVKQENVTGPQAGIVLPDSDVEVVIENNIFSYNKALEGATLNLSDVFLNQETARLKSNIFTSNNATKGGAIKALRTNLLLTNNVFLRNDASSQGGAIYLNSTGAYSNSCKLVNNSFSQNSSSKGGALNSASYSLEFLNNIFWQDSATVGPELYLYGGKAAVVNCDIDTSKIFGIQEIETFEGIINQDPIFCSGLMQSSNSPCRDAGIAQFIFPDQDTLSAPTMDIRGSIRPLGNGYDLGAYEVDSPGIIHVPADYPTIQQAINAASCGDTVLVADGVYYEQVNFQGKKSLLLTSNFILDNDSTHLYNTILDGSQLPYGQASVVIFSEGTDTTSVLSGFTITKGCGTYYDGNFIGGGIFLESSGGKIIHNKITQNRIISDSTGYSSSAVGGGIGTNSYENPNWIVINENIITGNICQNANNVSKAAGIYVSCNVICEKNIVSNNKSSGRQSIAAGVCFDASLVTPKVGICKSNKIIRNLSIANDDSYGCGFTAFNYRINFSENKVIGNIVQAICYSEGAGADIGGGIATIKGNYFEGNICRSFGGNNVSSYSFGGCLCLVSCSVAVEDNIFKHNQAEAAGSYPECFGGGICVGLCNLIVKNNVFHLNESLGETKVKFGGAIYIFDYNNACLINNTFSENTAEYGGAIFTGSKTKFLNNIFWQDSAAYGAEIFGSGSIAYCNIDTSKVSGSFEILEGNIFQNPLFCETNCLQPETGSPCLNKGIGEFIFPNGDTLTAPEYDIVGQLRPAGAGYDMGAYELLIESIPEGKNLLEFAVYPNPFVDNLWCHYRLDEKSDVTITVYDILGRVQLSWHKVQKAGEYDTPLELGTLVNGIYLIKTEINGREITGKVIKQDR